MRVIHPIMDQEYLLWLAGKVRKYPTFWEDHLRLNPTMSFLNIFAARDSFVVDIGPREGVLAFKRTPPGYRLYLFGLHWGRSVEARNPKLRRTAAAAALVALEATVLDGITSWDNKKARRAMEASGMRFRGRIKGGLWYDGVEKDGAWYELHRDDLQLPEI